jgi:flagellar basal-body rod protein FlgB
MINDSVITLLEKAVSGTVSRQKAISNNISNANTPAYKRVDVDFKTTLSSLVNKSQDLGSKQFKQISDESEYKTYREENTSLRQDGNNVDIDKEMTLLAKNSMEYEYYISLLTTKFRMIKTAINEGR